MKPRFYYAIEFGTKKALEGDKPHWQPYRFCSAVERDTWASAQPREHCERMAVPRTEFRRRQRCAFPVLTLGVGGFAEVASLT